MILTPAARRRKLEAARRRVTEALELLDAVHAGRDVTTVNAREYANQQAVARSAEDLARILSTLNDLVS